MKVRGFKNSCAKLGAAMVVGLGIVAVNTATAAPAQAFNACLGGNVGYGFASGYACVSAGWNGGWNGGGGPWYGPGQPWAAPVGQAWMPGPPGPPVFVLVPVAQVGMPWQFNNGCWGLGGGPGPWGPGGGPGPWGPGPGPGPWGPGPVPLMGI